MPQHTNPLLALYSASSAGNFLTLSYTAPLRSADDRRYPVSDEDEARWIAKQRGALCWNF